MVNAILKKVVICKKCKYENEFFCRVEDYKKPGKIKAKMFASKSGYENLETEINFFLEGVSKVISVNYQDTMPYCSALIVYRE